MSDTNESTAPKIAAEAPMVQVPAPAPKKPRRLRRFILMFSLPLALALGGGYYYVTGGRYVSTENAYVQQDKVMLGAEVSGRVTDIRVAQDQPVKKGELLFAIDDEAYKIALAKADGAIEAARLQVEQMRSTLTASKVQLDTAREDLAYKESLLARQQKLRLTGFNKQTDLEESQHDLNVARQSVAAAEAQVASALAQLGGNPDIKTEDHPVMLGALAARDQARLDLEHTRIVAPVNGTISQMANLQLGEVVKPATPVIAIMQTEQSWVEANFNETDLEHVKPGQKATLQLDAYPDQDLTGEVTSIGAGTGSVFSLLPAQNATGNWVKVVQRVPVRLKITGGKVPPLRAGLSVSVSVDTGHQRALPGFVRTAMSMIGLEPRLAYAEPNP